MRPTIALAALLVLAPLPDAAVGREHPTEPVPAPTVAEVPAGVALDPDGTLLSASGPQEGGGAAPLVAPDDACLGRIDLAGTRFPDGGAPLRPGLVLVAEFRAGRISSVGLDRRSAPVRLHAIAVAADGTVSGTARIFDSVVKIETGGAVTAVATAEAGVTGSTVAAFRRMAENPENLKVIGRGGVVQPPADRPAGAA